MKLLTLATPCKEQVHSAYMLSILSAINSLRSRTGYTPLVKLLIGKSNIDQARSMIMQDWYGDSDDTDLIFFIDSDHVFEPNDIVKAITLMFNENADVVCGVYPNNSGASTTIPVDFNKFINRESNDILYGATGFMLISRPIINRLIAYFNEHNIKPARISDGQYEHVYPFFKQQIIKSEVRDSQTMDWIGEDYGFCWQVRQIGGTIKAFFSNTLGHEVPNIRVYYPYINNIPYFGNTVEDDSEIIYYCGFSKVQFSPESTNLGGSEKAVVNLALCWQKRGHSVSVYGNVKEGVYDGVKYYSASRFNPNQLYKIVVLWRFHGLEILPIIKSERIYVDLHDASPHERFSKYLNVITKIFVKSRAHMALYSQIPNDKFVVIPNGLEMELYDTVRKSEAKDLVRNPYRMCYTSCYSRGLIPMLKHCWPEIIKQVPEAELHIYYGWDLLQREEVMELKPYLQQKGVFEHGRVSSKEIAIEKFTSAMHFYLCHVPIIETDCLSVRESYYAGCMPILSNNGVFGERNGIKIGTGENGQITADTYKLAIETIVKYMRNPAELQNMFQPSRELSWQEVADYWLSV